MNSYYIRALTRAELVSMGVDLGLLVDDEAGARGAQADIIWDEIGAIYAPTGQLAGDGQPITAPVTDAQGQTYWHANLYMPHVLADWAQAQHDAAVAAGNDDLAQRIAQHIANQDQYFPLDADGQPRRPNNPQRVLWL